MIGPETRIVVDIEWNECKDLPNEPPQYSLVTDIFPEVFPSNPDTLETYFIDKEELPKMLRAGVKLYLDDLKKGVANDDVHTNQVTNAYL